MYDLSNKVVSLERQKFNGGIDLSALGTRRAFFMPSHLSVYSNIKNYI